MDTDNSRFTPELLEMMRDEEREKFLIALKNGASWSQLYQIRNTIKKLNDMIETAQHNQRGLRNDGDVAGRSEDSIGPRGS